MNTFKGLIESLSLCIAGAMFIAHANANDDGARADESVSIDDSAAKERYEQLMSQAEGAGRTCMIANTFKGEMLEALRNFAKSARFIDLDPHRPIKMELPDGYYHPLGRTVTFDQLDLAIDRLNPSKPYVSMTRTSEGVKLEPKVAILLKEGKVLCVRNLSATVNYKSEQP